MDNRGQRHLRRIDDILLLGLASARKKQLFSADPVPVQKKLLLHLLKKNRSTTHGNRYKFNEIRTGKEFLRRIPPHEYRRIEPFIDAIIHDRKNVMFAGSPVCFGRTTGTDGSPKRIPLNSVLLRHSRLSAVDAALLGGLAKGSLRWHSGKTFYIGPRKGTPLGSFTLYAEGTAFAYCLSKWQVKRFIPEYHLLPEADAPQDHSLLAQLAATNKMAIVAGNPEEIADFLISTGIILPDVDIIFNCGGWVVDFLPIYQKALPNAHVVDVYGANEGTWGLPVKPGVFLLNYRRIVFSFLPLTGPERSILLEDAAPGQKYELCVTTGGGLYHYRTGDIVSMVSLRPPLIRLCGRKSRILPLDGEWITENEVVFAVKNSGLDTLNYYLTNERGGYMLITDAASADAGRIDSGLCAVNPAYRRLREAGALSMLKTAAKDFSKKPNKKPIRIQGRQPS